MLNVVADGEVRAWHEDEPIALSRLDDWHLGSFAVPPDADHVELRVEIDDAPRVAAPGAVALSATASAAERAGCYLSVGHLARLPGLKTGTQAHV
jgi:hypothetical protein